MGEQLAMAMHKRRQMGKMCCMCNTFMCKSCSKHVMSCWDTPARYCMVLVSICMITSLVTKLGVLLRMFRDLARAERACSAGSGGRWMLLLISAIGVAVVQVCRSCCRMLAWAHPRCRITSRCWHISLR